MSAETISRMAYPEAAVRLLWEHRTELLNEPKEMRDSSVAHHGVPMRGSDLYRIGKALGFIEEEEPS